MNQDIALAICDKIGMDPLHVVCKKGTKYPGFNLVCLIDALISTKELSIAGEILGGYSEVTLSKNLGFLRSKINKNPAERWYSPLLRLVSLKKCACCGDILHIDLFHADKSRVDNLRKYCIDCCRDYVETNMDQILEYRKNYYIDNKSDFIARVALRRARKIQATPAWADLAKIKEIYKGCPEGSEVDHIIPIAGDLVCGLHVEHNLQYLTVSANRSKGNTFSS